MGRILLNFELFIFKIIQNKNILNIRNRVRVRSQDSEAWCQVSGVTSQKLEVRSQESEIRGLDCKSKSESECKSESKVKSLESEVRSQESEVRSYGTGF